MRSLITSAFEQWLDVDDWDNFRSVGTMAWNQSSGEWTIDMDDISGFGGTSCSSRNVVLDESLLNNHTLLATIATHEMGHVLGLNHTGWEDSFDSNKPIMGICDYDNMEVAQDDRGNVVRLLGDLSPGTIHANAGFEMGSKEYWGKSSVASWSVSTLNTLDGDYNLRFKPSATNGYVYQTMNVAADETSTDFDARFNYRKVSTGSTTGKMTMQILSRRVEYGFISSGCEYNRFQGGATINQNDVNHSQYGFSVVRTESRTPTTSWATRTESTPYFTPLNWEGVDLRIRVLSAVILTSSGNFAKVSIDTTRVRLVPRP